MYPSARVRFRVRAGSTLEKQRLLFEKRVRIRVRVRDIKL